MFSPLFHDTLFDEMLSASLASEFPTDLYADVISDPLYY